MKLRLFWTMLLAFMLVIVLGVCGMIGIFSLAAAGIWRPAQVITELRAVQAPYTDALERYYQENGNSWAGVDARLTQPPFSGADGRASFIVTDRNQRVIASDIPGVRVGQKLDDRQLGLGVPLVVQGDRVGTLAMRPLAPVPPFGPGMMGWPADRQPAARDIALRVGSSFLVAGLALVGILLGLAVIFTGWLNRPLRRISRAAGDLADGRLDTRVSGASIRELDDLSRSFNSMASSLATADQQRRQLTADVAHELRTPLTIIKGRLEGIQDGVYDASPEEIRRLLDETALLERLVEDLRLLALADAGQLPLYPETIDPADLLEQTAASFAGPAREQGVALRVEAPESLPAVQVDPQRMAQVLANLVSNALRYTPAGGEIALCAEAKASNSVVLTVRDTGQGIPPDELPQIFDRFWRSDRSRTRSRGGAGLGLAITRQIVEAHDGTISAESTPGQGTRIHITLPAA